MGSHHTLTNENKQKFLSMFGIKNIEKDIQKLEERKWKTPLEPIYVIRKNKTENRIHFYETVDFDYNKATFSLKSMSDKNKQILLIDWPGKSEEHKEIDGTIYHKHYFNIPNLKIGYYELSLKIGSKTSKSTLVIAPESCYFPDSLKTKKVTGIACHLYSAYSDHSQGIGDFTDLQILAEKTKEAGGDMILTQPWHYTSILTRDNQSPYFPLSRLFLNPLYIDLSALGIKPDKYMNLGQYVEYDRVIDYKIPLLREYFKAHKKDEGFLNFIKGHKLLDKFACFCALYAKFGKMSWQDWDKNYQKPNSAEIETFSEDNADEIQFYKFLQYLAEQQQAETYQATKEMGMRFGLCNDLAVGSCMHSFETWYYGKKLFITDASIGAPPDHMNRQGQSWGCAPYSPQELRNSGYSFYIEILRRSMKNAGALRLDHAMHIMRLFFNIDKTNRHFAGSFVYMNMDEMLGIIALESHLHKCLIIAEDLGTVADGFRERLKEEQILTTKELYFEKDDNGFFKKPEDYDKGSISMVHTHDTPTIKGYLKSNDIDLQLELGIIDKKMYKEIKNHRELACAEMVQRHHLSHKRDLIDIFNNTILESNSCVSLICIDDFTNEIEQLNLPGTVLEHKNWCRKLSKSIEDIEIKL